MTTSPAAVRRRLSTQPVGRADSLSVYLDDGWEFGLSFLGTLVPDGRAWRADGYLADLLGNAALQSPDAALDALAAHPAIIARIPA